MALIKCCECGTEVSDLAENCPKCGCPVSVSLKKIVDDEKEAAKKKAEEKKAAAEKKALQEKKSAEKAEKIHKNKKKIIIILSAIAVLAAAAIIVGLAVTKDQRVYKKGHSAFDEGNYSKALDCFSQIPGYEDADNLAEKSAHYIDVANDTTPPSISGIKDGEKIEVDYNSAFNVYDYIAGKISISDAVSGKIDEYKIETESDVLDKKTGAIRTDKGGDFDFIISASDEAGNEAKNTFTITIDETLYIDANAELPVVIYDGELGKLTFTGIKHYSIYTISRYEIDYTFENRYTEDLDAYTGHCYLDDNHILIYSYYNNDVAPGKKGNAVSYWSDSDMTEEMKGFDNIELHFIIGHFAPNINESIFERPVVISSSLIKY